MLCKIYPEVYIRDTYHRLVTRYMSQCRDSIHVTVSWLDKCHSLVTRSHDQNKILHITQRVVTEGGRLESDVCPASSSTDPADRQGILPGQSVE